MCALRKCPARCRTLWGCVPSPSLLRRTRSAVQRRSPWQRDGVGWGARCPQIQWFYHHFTVPVTRNMAITGGHTPLFRHSNIFIGIFHVSHMVGLDICVYKHVNRYKHKIYAYDVDALHVLFAIYIAYTYIYIQLYFGADVQCQPRRSKAISNIDFIIIYVYALVIKHSNGQSTIVPLKHCLQRIFTWHVRLPEGIHPQ
jgi:hypothetical protein